MQEKKKGKNKEGTPLDFFFLPFILKFFFLDINARMCFRNHLEKKRVFLFPVGLEPGLR